jgi:N-acetylglucosamine-6-sulfatase
MEDRTSHTAPHRRARLPLAAGLLALLCGLALALGGPHRASAAESRPSFVVIQTDDQTLDELYAAYTPYPGAPAIRAMPNTLELLAKRGVTFNRYYVSYPLCCPSRVTLMTGRYAHNTGVKGNVQPNGGYYGFSFRAAYDHNIATWLNGAGYRTIHIGKFLNGYGDEPYSSGAEVPPGWDAWHTVLKADTDHYFYGYMLNNADRNSAGESISRVEGPYGDPGSWETREYGVRDDPGCPFAPANGLPCYYATDVLTNYATQELQATPPEQPFYLQLDYTAPHGDFRHPAGPEPAPRDYGMFEGAPLPHDRAEGFDEGNVSDKPRFIREAPHLTPTDKHVYRVYYDKQLESLRSVDDGVKQVIDTLGGLHRLRNTYIFFTSDNGFFFGEHRLLGGKFLAYEPATHLPLLVRGPGIRPGSSTGELAANIDIAPTILELAGVKPDKSIDGRSLQPFWRDTSLRTRRPILFESFVATNDVEANGAISTSGEGDGGPPGGNGSTGTGAAGSAHASSAGPHAHASLLAPPKDYEGIRLGPYKYIAWPDGEKELYDINRDPYELNNLARIPDYYPIRNFLHEQLRKYEDCVGRECSEPVPEIPLTRTQRERVRAQERQEKREQRQREREQRERERHHP